MSKLITSKQLCNLIEQEYGGLVVALRTLKSGNHSTYYFDYEEGFIYAGHEPDALERMSKDEFLDDWAGSQWVVEQLGDLSLTEVEMAIKLHCKEDRDGLLD